MLAEILTAFHPRLGKSRIVDFSLLVEGLELMESLAMSNEVYSRRHGVGVGTGKCKKVSSPY